MTEATESVYCAVLTPDGNEIEATIDIVSLADDRLRLSLRAAGGDPVEGVAESIFEALREIRRELEGRGSLLLVAGAGVHVYPSAMSLAMGEGRYAYRLTLGRPASNANLVDVLSPLPREEVGTVSAQEEFYASWLSSLSS